MNRSAGIGDPYWYEWGIGLLKAVEMLNPDSGIVAVAFQKAGIKGWDDVVIQYRSGASQGKPYVLRPCGKEQCSAVTAWFFDLFLA